MELDWIHRSRESIRSVCFDGVGLMSSDGNDVRVLVTGI